MSELTLTYAGFNYLDRTLPLQLGDIQPEGVDLRFVTIREIGDLFRRAAQFQEFDVSEMSLSTLMLMIGRGNRELVGLPIFPSRTFRHGFIFVRTDGPVKKPADLKGKVIGAQDYQATAFVWLRYHLEHEYGVSPSDMTWLIGGLDVPSGLERLRHAPPPGVEMHPVPAGKTLEGMLLDGEVDMLMTPERIESVVEHPDQIRRLIPDYVHAEAEFWKRTGFFPIMHTVALRRDVYEANRWLARSLVDAFERARRAGQERLRKVTSPAIALPWLEDAIAELDSEFGGEALPIGLPANRAIVELMLEASHEQGLAQTELEPEDIFAEEVWDYVPDP
jgi:4,5-dihydroxyphthalate decarboxylase